MHKIYRGLALGLILTGSGCAGLSDRRYVCSKTVDTYLAWRHAGQIPANVAHGIDYAHGWRAGYYDVATGGRGCVPVVPPEKYWAPKYQSPSGQRAISDWYAGFQDGAITAEQRGAGNWHVVPSAGGGSVAHDFMEEPLNSTTVRESWNPPTPTATPSENVPVPRIATPANPPVNPPTKSPEPTTEPVKRAPVLSPLPKDVPSQKPTTTVPGPKLQMPPVNVAPQPRDDESAMLPIRAVTEINDRLTSRNDTATAAIRLVSTVQTGDLFGPPPVVRDHAKPTSDESSLKIRPLTEKGN